MSRNRNNFGFGNNSFFGGFSSMMNNFMNDPFENDPFFNSNLQNNSSRQRQQQEEQEEYDQPTIEEIDSPASDQDDYNTRNGTNSQRTTQQETPIIEEKLKRKEAYMSSSSDSDSSEYESYQNTRNQGRTDPFSSFGFGGFGGFGGFSGFNEENFSSGMGGGSGVSYSTSYSTTTNSNGKRTTHIVKESNINGIKKKQVKSERAIGDKKIYQEEFIDGQTGDNTKKVRFENLKESELPEFEKQFGSKSGIRNIGYQEQNNPQSNEQLLLDSTSYNDQNQLNEKLKKRRKEKEKQKKQKQKQKQKQKEKQKQKQKQKKLDQKQKQKKLEKERKERKKEKQKKRKK
ncbi:bromodomain adjacent to zinc finger domain 2a [Anaeramoeba flamelloides]|uniref:Bromodomain adjacent to zinc finger domain 2a n=1 Tax=Anaeramoeba flamelloides TaxID=1746091 RepID=A0AAV7YZN8_9EUKA|nr:bromodomain adjacent to zinc finger domain 2a [Anaeramoeba flamelloides]